MIIHPYTSQTVTSQKKAASGQSKIVDVTMLNVEAELLQASVSLPVLVDFWAPWCEPCKQFLPLLEGLQKSYSKPWILAKVNVDEQGQLAAQFRIQSIPSVVMIAKGRPVEAFMGAVPETQIVKLLDKAYQFYKDDFEEDEQDPLVEAEKSFNRGDYTRSATLLSQCLGQAQKLAEADATRLILSYAFLGQNQQAVGFLSLLEKPTITSDWLSAWQGNPAEVVSHWLVQLLTQPEVKTKLVELFSLLGSEHTLVQEGRKKMSRILFA